VGKLVNDESLYKNVKVSLQKLDKRDGRLGRPGAAQHSRYPRCRVCSSTSLGRFMHHEERKRHAYVGAVDSQH